MPILGGYFIDWLAVTFSEYVEQRALSSPIVRQLTGLQAMTWKPTDASLGYRYAIENHQGVRAFFGTRAMGTHVIFSGEALNSVRAEGITTENLIRHMKGRGARAARLDLAVDAVDTNLEVEGLYNALMSHEAETRSVKFSRLQSEAGGDTVYVGSRTSERFLRVYNKFAEQRGKSVPVDAQAWIRVELELKAGSAAQVFNWIASERDTTLEDIVRFCIRDFCHFPGNQAWVALMNSADLKMGSSVRALSDTDAWLLDVAAKCLARRVKNRPELLHEFNERIRILLE